MSKYVPEAERQVPLATATALAPVPSPAETEETQLPKPKPGCNKKWLWLVLGVGGAIVLVVVAAVLGVTLSTASGKSNPTSACNGDQLVEVTEVNRDSSPEGLRRLIADTEYLSIGCFRTQESPDKRALVAITHNNKAEECNSYCKTDYFGIADSTCYCHPDSPQDRLSIGSCQFTENPCVEDDQK